MLLKLVLPILLLKMRLNRKSKIVYMTYTCGICYITVGSAVVYLQKYILCVTRNKEHSYIQDCFSLGWQALVRLQRLLTGIHTGWWLAAGLNLQVPLTPLPYLCGSEPLQDSGLKRIMPGKKALFGLWHISIAVFPLDLLVVRLDYCIFWISTLPIPTTQFKNRLLIFLKPFMQLSPLGFHFISSPLLP